MRKVPATEAEVLDEFWDRTLARANGQAVPSLASAGSIAEKWDRVLARIYGEDAATADPDTPAPASTGADLDAAWDRVLARTNPTTKIEQRPARWWEPAAAQVTDAPVAITPTVEPVAASPTTPPVPLGPAASTAEPTMPASVEYFLERCERFRSNRFASIFR